jgi:hypothetical protein
MSLRRKIIAVTASAAAVLGMAATATPASAVGKNGVLESGELGLYFLSGFRPPIFDLFLSDSNFADDVFPGTGIGADNNTESARNNDTFTWHVHTGANFTGSDGCMPPGLAGDFIPAFKNTVSSARFTSTPC